jgi:HEAT repeat protein
MGEASRMKIRLESADTSGDMGPSTPDKTPSPKSKADLARDHVVAADTERVAGWIDAVARAIDGRRMHPRNDSALHKVNADLEAFTRSCLHQTGGFAIRVEEFDLLYEGHCVRHSTSPKGSLSAALFREGLRELTIRQGLDSDELIAFVDILKCATDESDPDSEDAVTLLWERNFQHIDYVCAPPEEWEPELRSEGEEPAAGAVDAGVPWPTGMQAEGEIDSGSGSDGPSGERSDDWSLRAGSAPRAVAAPAVPPEFTEIEASNVLMVAKIEDVVTPRERVLEIVTAVIAEEENPAEYLELASIIGRLVEHAVREGDMEGATQLVDRLRGTSKIQTAAPGEFQAAADRVLEEIGRSDFLVRLGTTLNRDRPVDLGALTSFLAQLGPSAAPTLCDLLGEIGEMKVRRAVCDALAISCRNDVDILIKRLSDPRWFVVRNILYILGRIAHHGVERALGDALYHSDARVRREAVRAIGEIKSPASRAYLNSALRDPDKTVRILVAAALAERNDERAARIIWGVIESPEFAGRDADERLAFFQALGATGSEALVPRIEQILTRGGLFKTANQDGRVEAAMALAWLGTPAALAILSREVKSRNEAVRRAVTEALESLRKITPRGRQGGWEGEAPAGGK